MSVTEFDSIATLESVSNVQELSDFSIAPRCKELTSTSSSTISASFSEIYSLVPSQSITPTSTSIVATNSAFITELLSYTNSKSLMSIHCQTLLLGKKYQIILNVIN